MTDGIQKVTITSDSRPEFKSGGVKQDFSSFEINGKDCTAIRLDESTYAKLKTRPEGKYDLVVQRFDGKPLDQRVLSLLQGSVKKIKINEQTYKALTDISLSSQFDLASVKNGSDFVKKTIAPKGKIDSNLENSRSRRNDEIRHHKKTERLLAGARLMLEKYSTIPNSTKDGLEAIQKLKEHVAKYEKSIEDSKMLIKKFENEIKILENAESPKENAIRRLGDAKSAMPTIEKKIKQVLAGIKSLDLEVDKLMKLSEPPANLNNRMEEITARHITLYEELGQLNYESDELENRMTSLERLVQKEESLEKLGISIKKFAGLLEQVESGKNQTSVNSDTFSAELKQMQLETDLTHYSKEMKQSLDLLKNYFADAAASHEKLGNSEESKMAKIQLKMLGLASAEDPDAAILEIVSEFEQIENQYLIRMTAHKKKGNFDMYLQEANRLNAMLAPIITSFNCISPLLPKTFTRITCGQRLTRPPLTLEKCIKEANRSINKGKPTSQFEKNFEDLSSFFTGKRERARAHSSFENLLRSARNLLTDRSKEINSDDELNLSIKLSDRVKFLENFQTMFKDNRFDEMYRILIDLPKEDGLNRTQLPTFIINLMSVQKTHPELYPIRSV